MPKKLKIGRPKLKSYKNLWKQAWQVFSEYIRLRDRYICFTCNQQLDKNTSDAGHYIHRNCLDFNEININTQCTKCNRYLSGNTGIYAERLIKKYGLEKIDKLRELSYQIRKFSRIELEEIIEEYKEKLKELENEN